MLSKENRAKLYASKQPDGRYRKEIENTGVFLSGIDEMLPFIAQQPNGVWQAFDHEPILTLNGWYRVGDRPNDLTIEGNLNIPWNKTLCINERYNHIIKRVRKTIKVKGF